MNCLKMRFSCLHNCLLAPTTSLTNSRLASTKFLMKPTDLFLLLLGASHLLDVELLGKQMYSYFVLHSLLLETVHSSLVHCGLAVVVTVATSSLHSWLDGIQCH